VDRNDVRDVIDRRIGHAGIRRAFLVRAVLQHGLRYSPLQSGLAVTPFALGGAVSAAVAGWGGAAAGALQTGQRIASGRPLPERDFTAMGLV
jgi:hypothetical protein